MTNNTNLRPTPIRVPADELARIAKALRTPGFDPLKGRGKGRNYTKHNIR